MNDDELEADLRRVLADPGHRLPDTLVPLEGVHAGARRRKSRRQAFAAVAGATAGVVGVVAFVAVNHLAHGGGTAVAGASLSTSGTLSTTATAPASTEPSLSPTPSETASAFAVKTQAPVPTAFSPVSVTAVGPNTWWVLGKGGEVLSTVDGGKSFAYVGDPATSGLPTSATELRFADVSHGWAVTPVDSSNATALWQTSDGGAHWTGVALTGVVATIELGGGEAYALSRKGASWEVLEAPADGSGGWQSLGSVSSIGTADFPPLLAVQGTRAIVADRTANTDRTWVFDRTGGHTASTQPCAPDLGAMNISATSGGVWLSCARGMGDELYRSVDGTSWTPVSGGSGSGSRYVVGAIDGTHAAVGEVGQIYVVSTTGQNDPATGDLTSSDQWSYLAFTNAHDGFAIDDINGRMLRTTNGGMSWTQIAFH